MFFLENPPPDPPEPLFHFTLGMNPLIDFCVWVLEVDGLRVPPFDQHPDGDQSLRARGMTSDAWRTWVTRTALLLDQRLHWPNDLATERQHRRDGFLQWQQQAEADYPDLDLPPFDSPALIREVDRQATWQVEQGQKARAVVRELYGDTPPPDVWLGNEIDAWSGSPAVAERLRELRTEYPFRNREREWLTYELDPDSGVPVGIGELVVETAGLSELLRPYQERLGGLELHFVVYPQPIEFPIPLGALVVSPSHAPSNQQQFEERIVRAVERLVTLNEP